MPLKLSEGPITIKLPKPGEKRIQPQQDSSGKFINSSSNNNGGNSSEMWNSGFDFSTPKIEEKVASNQNWAWDTPAEKKEPEVKKEVKKDNDLIDLTAMLSTPVEQNQGNANNTQIAGNNQQGQVPALNAYNLPPQQGNTNLNPVNPQPINTSSQQFVQPPMQSPHQQPFNPFPQQGMMPNAYQQQVIYQQQMFVQQQMAYPNNFASPTNSGNVQQFAFPQQQSNMNPAANHQSVPVHNSLQTQNSGNKQGNQKEGAKDIHYKNYTDFESSLINLTDLKEEKKPEEKQTPSISNPGSFDPSLMNLAREFDNVGLGANRGIQPF